MTQGWRFLDPSGTFVLDDPHKTSYLYFPLVNEAGLSSCLTPTLHGDVKTGQNTFLMTPVSVEDLHNSRAARNFWVNVDGVGAWSATGNSARQIAQPDTERVTLEAGLLWHKVTRESPPVGLRAEITSFVPASDDPVELMQVKLTNITHRPLTITPTAAIPIYGRSADNLRDHRHVTSLLHRITTHRHGVLVRPTLSFNERGHYPNSLTYGVLGAAEDGTPPQDFCPIVEEFIGEGGCLEWPGAIVGDQQSESGQAKVAPPFYLAGRAFAGYEAIGALRFGRTTLRPGQSQSYIIILAIMPEATTPDGLIQTYGGRETFEAWAERTRAYWQHKLDTLAFHTGDGQHDLWLKWVTLQPILRRLMGNSFLPYHDYGRGGRGWRDLWQDCLALLMLEPDHVPELLFSNFAGVRVDGSNATIIGTSPGEFLADRNDIARIWMDHGAWPWLTTRLYLDQTGDLAFLLREQTYFKDQHVNRSRAIDPAWTPEQGTLLHTASGQVYRGTVLEHLLVQHLTAFFNVGEHNNIKLEDADWNDGLDMAAERGESVAFTALYASNLRDLSQWLLELDRRGFTTIELMSELRLLLDTLAQPAPGETHHLTGPIDYESATDKQQRLQAYFAACRHTISGDKLRVTTRDLAHDLAAKADWLTHHLRTREWLRNREGYAWFNGYYDNDGMRVEGDHPQGVRMTLTGQVFTLMGGIATEEQARSIVRSVEHYLFDPTVGGYRLNTNFGETLLNLGRCFGFAFGTKENGAMFSHMAMMYANALYRRGFVPEGFKVLDCIYRHCVNFEICRIYPGIPEYVNAKGRGAYPYLTGSASWLLLTLLTEVFGVKGRRGDLLLEPKLVREQFAVNGQASVETLFAGKRLHVVYHNDAGLDYGDYHIATLTLNGEPVTFERSDQAIVLPRATLARLDNESQHRVDVILNTEQEGKI